MQGDFADESAQLTVWDGLPQGETTSSLVFAWCHHMAVEQFWEKTKQKGIPDEAVKLFVAYMDDGVMVLKVQWLKEILAIWEQCLGNVGLALQKKKCFALVLGGEDSMRNSGPKCAAPLGTRPAPEVMGTQL